MRNISVNTFINILFGLVLSLLVTALFLFISWDKERQKSDELSRYRLISNALLSTAQLNPTQEELEKFYRNSHVKPVAINANRMLILSKGKVIFEGESIYGRMQIFAIGDTHYIYLQRYGFRLMLKDTKSRTIRFNITIFIAILVSILFIFLYIAITSKLSPLKKLNKKILEFAKGNMDIKITYRSNDEIGQIAQSFDNAIYHIKTLLESKNLFMRNMMHELKTPITKGRIVVEMIEDGNNKKTLIRAFERMNQLIGELAYIERLTTQSFQPELREVNINDIIEKSLTLLLLTKEKVTIKTDNNLITTDAKLLSLALKNLIDNAIKYSEDCHVTIITDDTSIKVLSKGKSLEHPLEYYLEPFTQEEKRQSGFGLGLYIVNNIIQRLDYKLHYYYKDSNNVFEIQINK
ncbi:MAG TPA: HAMP domain-containing histidine kinase [Campylobacterales bacterium]|nr:HAMP domain-containing histidine kinase [Campylobacterales bacterium]HHH51694.1 HAMP domain-containing histidine kinase [Campylobacterales bacterium]